MILMDLLKIQLEGRYLGRDIFLFIFYSDSTAFSSTKYVREFRIRDFMLNEIWTLFLYSFTERFFVYYNYTKEGFL